jgi:hypothetical protein
MEGENVANIGHEAQLKTHVGNLLLSGYSMDTQNVTAFHSSKFNFSNRKKRLKMLKG